MMFLQFVTVLLFLFNQDQKASSYSLKNCEVHGLLTNRTKVLCYDRQLTHVPAYLPSKLFFLDVSQNNITSLRKSDFTEMSNLHILNVSQNKIGHIEEGAFVHTSRMEILNLTTNQLIEPSAFNLSTTEIISVLVRLRELDASHNPISLIDIATPALQSLLSLDVSYSTPRGSTVWLKQDPCFLKGLKIIYLGGMAMIPSNISALLQMLNCSVLEIIHLNHLNLTESDGLIEKVCLSHPNVKTLNLQGNRFTSIEAETFENCTQLRSLNMSSNRLNMLPPTLFQSLHFLQVLSLVDNKFTSVPNATSNITSLESLDLGFNKFHIISPADFINLPSIKSLCIIGNHISHVHSDLFGSLYSLQELNLGENHLRKLKEPFSAGLAMLKTLLLNHNNLASIKKGIFKNLTSLRVLNLVDNQIVTIEPGAWEGLNNLRSLVLGSNRITRDTLQDGTFQGVSSLEELQLFSNYISYESTKSLANPPFQHLHSLKKLNPKTQVLHFYQYTCASPPAFKGKKLLVFKKISCISDCMFILYVANMTAVLLLMLVCFFYQWRMHMIYSYYLLLAYFIDKRQKRKGQCMEYDYDAFLSYNKHDEQWVINDLLPVLENQYCWKLCLHHRDFQPGRPILENIVDNIYASRKTICIISHHYLNSEWCSKEIQVASFRIFDDCKDVLVLIFLEDIPSEYLSPYHRMRELVKKKTYLKWPKDEQEIPLFWLKLNMAMKTAAMPREAYDHVTGVFGGEIALCGSSARFCAMRCEPSHCLFPSDTL
uniref:TIR domain-containing protein n=1 Tax=Varanus komodoensis TaxID=61221 RepID=A0A8D2LCF1_VARKO